MFNLSEIVLHMKDVCLLEEWFGGLFCLKQSPTLGIPCVVEAGCPKICLTLWWSQSEPSCLHIVSVMVNYVSFS